ncbi:Hypp4609 [Branchiostoma lanceolatum]|uniref:Hypp4609 protein n=1 Tax=Branchiostoma lanceolatum TaxID=7740 RepID=A0A8K0F238_BRALA|nr:Hypp4609 [Branchiostoma lanceolatum]
MGFSRTMQTRYQLLMALLFVAAIIYLENQIQRLEAARDKMEGVIGKSLERDARNAGALTRGGFCYVQGGLSATSEPTDKFKVQMKGTFGNVQFPTDS